MSAIIINARRETFQTLFSCQRLTKKGKKRRKIESFLERLAAAAAAVRHLRWLVV
jgi:hypothetical protein